MFRHCFASTVVLTSTLLLACGSAPASSGGDSGSPAPSPQPDAGGPAPDASVPQPDADAPGPDADAADSAPPPFAPTDLSGLSLWLRATDGLHLDANGDVVAWDDQSGHNNTAMPTPSAAPRHTLYAGAEAVQFSEQQALQLNDASSLRWNGDFAVVVVAASLQPAMTYGMLYGKSAAAYPYAGPALMADYPNGPKGYTGAIGGQVDIQDAVVSTPTKLDDYSMRVYGLVRTGSSIALRVNGDAPSVQLMANPPQDTTAVGAGAFVGGHPQNGGVIQGFEGVILEVIGVDGTLSDSEYAQIWTYASQRYGL
jgi:hypothetical protein